MTALLTDNLPLLAEAPNGIQKLRELILELAVRGKLVPQDPDDEPASELLERISEERERLIADGVIKKQKAPSEIENDQIPFDVPASWKWVRVAAVGHAWGQKTPDRDFTYIDVGCVDNVRGVILSPEVVAAKAAPSRARKVVKPGTLIYSTIRPYLLNVAVVDEAYESEPIASTAFAIVHPYAGMPPRYFLWYLRSPTFIDYVESVQMGIAYPAINDGQFFSGLVPLPPLAEQDRIVAKVDELMALCDRLEARQADAECAHAQLVQSLLDSLAEASDAEDFAQNWQRLSEQFHTLFTTESSIDALKQTLLHLGVMGKLVPQDPTDQPACELISQIAEARSPERKSEVRGLEVMAGAPFELRPGWEWIKLGAIATVERGGSPRPIKEFMTTDSDGLNWIKIGDTEKGGKYITSAKEKIKPDGLSKTRMVCPGDFLLTNSMSFGRPYITQIEGCIHDGWLRISPPSSLVKDYLYILLSSGVVRDFFSRAAAGAVVLNLNADKVRDLPIPLPPFPEQHRIVAKLDQLIGLCDQLEARVSLSGQTQEQLANALVEQAMA